MPGIAGPVVVRPVSGPLVPPPSGDPVLAWLDSDDKAEQTRLEREYQIQAFASLPFIPLGGYRQSAAWRDNITGILKGPSVVFWNVAKG